MKFNDAIHYLHNHPEQVGITARPAKHGGYICPCCESGSGKRGNYTGIKASKDKLHFTCYGGCFKNADAIDIIGVKYGITDFKEKVERAAQEAGITIEYNNGDKTPSRHNQSHVKRAAASMPASPEIRPLKQEAINPEIAEIIESDIATAQKHLYETNYHRGITLCTLKKFKVGFLASWKHPNKRDDKKVPFTPRLIIPTSTHSYLARDTRQNIPPAQSQYKKQYAGNRCLFNQSALEAGTPCFILEGEINALSVIDAGGNALAIGGTGNDSLLLATLNERKQALKQPLILAMDNDTAGREATKRIATGLEQIGVKYSIVNLAGRCNGANDANDALNQNRQRFTLEIRRAEKQALLEAMQ